MPHVFGVNPGISIERHLERKQGQHLLHSARHLVDPVLTPRPDLRADIIDNPQTRLFGPARKWQVEARRVDHDHHASSPFPRSPQQTPRHQQPRRDLGEHFDKAHHIQSLDVEQRFDPGGPKVVTAHSVNRQFRKFLP